jgi:shikimate kinase
MQMKVFLIGFMGTGKSYWASRLSKKLKVGCYDLDNLIESVEEKSITQIFAEDGEEYFRKVEAKMLRWFDEKKSFVLAVGGGTPCFAKNMEWMNAHGITIWLNENETTILERLKTEKEKRPLIQNKNDDELKTFVQTKLAERISFYQQAQIHLPSDQLNEKHFFKLLQNLQTLDV